MKSIRYIILLLIPLVLGCVRETSRGAAFEASFSLETPAVYDGDELSLTIRCNRSEFIMVSFDCPLTPGVLSPLTRCSTRDGAWLFREKVRISESSRGVIRIVIEDPVTGLRKEFSASYSAYASTALNLLIENPVIHSEGIGTALPTVVGGDDFVFTLSGRANHLTVRSFQCEFSDSLLVEGQELLLQGGDTTFRIPAVRAGDGFSPRTLSLMVHNPDNGRDTTLTASYVTAAAFLPEATLEPSRLIEGERTVLRLRANREHFQLKEYAGPSWFALEGWSKDSPDLSLNMEGYVTLHSVPLPVDHDGEGTVRLELFDSGYTLRSIIVPVPYTASVRTAPGDVSLSETSLTLTTDGTARIGVSTSAGHSTGLFTARVISGDGALLYAPPAGWSQGPDDVDPSQYTRECTVSGGELFLRGVEGRWGQVTVRVFAKGNESVYKDLSIYVRRDVALRIKGDFADEICYDPNTIDAIFSTLAGGTEGIGWYGLPRSIEAELVSWENRSSRPLTELSKEEVSSYLRCFSLQGSSSAGLMATFVVTVGSRVSSRLFFGTYASESEPRAYLLTGPGIDRTTELTLPGSINTTCTDASSYSNRINCKGLLSILRSLDCRADYQNGYGLFTMLRETIHGDDRAGFGSFDVSISLLSYDRSRYRVRWVMDLMEVPGEWGAAAPWWKEVPGERPWIQPYNE